MILSLLLLALPSLAQDNITARRPFGQHTQTFAASETFDAGITDNWKITLTGNVTSSTLIGVEAGHTYTFEICQDGAGSHTFVFPAQLANPISIPSGVNACITEVFQFDGTNGNIPTTTTSGGGGSGTVNSGTANQIAKYTGSTTVSSDANLDDGLTLANTLSYLGSGGISAQQLSAAGTGAMTFVGTNGTCSGITGGKTVVCAGDLTSNTMQISNSGDSFRSVATHQSTSPPPHAIMLAETFPQIFAAPRGTQGQAFLEGATGGDPGFGQFDLSLATNVINRLAKANQMVSTVYNDQVNTFTAAGTLDLSGSTVASAFRAPNVAGITTTINGAVGYDTTSNNFHGGVNSADAKFVVNTGTAPVHHNCAWWTNVSGHIELGDSTTTCGGGSTPRLDQVTSATNPWTTTNGDNQLSLQFAATTSGRNSLELTESAAATSGGSPHLLYVHTLAASTHFPCFFSARGTANGVICDPVTGTFSAIGTANINSTQINGVSVTGTPAVGQIPIATSSTASAWGDPIISQAYVNLWTAQDVTVTRTSAAVRNPIFSQTGTLQLTWASITGSPATCTLQIQGVDSQGNALNNGSTFSVSPANGTTSQTFTAAAGLQSAAQIKAIFVCGTYPTTGTLTLDYTPIPNVNVTNTIPVTVASLPLPSGAATSAKQPALGTAGTPSADVITVQGAASMTKLLVTPDANVKVNAVGNAGASFDAAGQNVASPANELLTGCQFNTSPTTITSGNMSPLQCGSGGKLLVTPDALPLHQSANVDQLNGTTTDTNSGIKSAGTLRVVLATDQPALTNKLLVTPDSVALPANQSVNAAQVAGTTTDTNSGNKSAGTQRVVIATDQPALTNKLLVTPDSVALPANQSVNVNQIAGTTADTNSGNKSAGTQRVVLATDQPSMTNPQPHNLTQVNGVSVATDGGNGRQLVGTYPDTVTTSYHTSKNVASAASATDISVLPGNATNTVLVYRVVVSCTQTTAGIITLQLIKRSTADTAGTSSSMTVVPDDSNYAAGVTAPLVYTANPTTGTAVGNLDTALVGCMATGTASPNDIYVFKPAKPIVLRGTAQQLAVNLNAATVTGGSFDITYEYAETTTP